MVIVLIPPELYQVIRDHAYGWQQPETRALDHDLSDPDRRQGLMHHVGNMPRLCRRGATMISKIDAAQEQLDAAIKLFFENVNSIPAFTLATASQEITDDLFDKKRNEILRREYKRHGDVKKIRFSAREEYEMMIKPEYLAEGRRLMRARQNFLKHADRDPDAEIESISTEILAIQICTAIMNFGLVTGNWTKAMSLFFGWFIAKNPRLLKEGVQDEFVDRIEIFRKASAELSHEQEMFFLRSALEAGCPEIFAREPPGWADALGQINRKIPW